MAVAELGQIHAFTFNEAVSKMNEIAQEKGIEHPMLVLAIRHVLTSEEFVYSQEEAAYQWDDLIEYALEHADYPMPIAFVIDADEYKF